MAQFLGASASILQEREYVDARSEMAQGPFQYVMRYRPSGKIPNKGRDPCAWTLPYSPGWSEGGEHISSPELRVGAGLTRTRGPREGSQVINPVKFQVGNGDRCATEVDSRLRVGEVNVRRGKARASMLQNAGVAFQQGQTPFVSFESTVTRARGKDRWATQDTAGYVTRFAPCAPQRIEPFVRGGETTRCATEFS